MSWHEFVLSKKGPNRYLRHIIFWLVCALYFFCGRYLLPQPTLGQQLQYLKFSGFDFFQLLLILFIQMLCCYVFIYVLLPKFFLRAKYVMFILTTIVLSIAVVMVTYFIQVTVMPFIDTAVLNTKAHAVAKTSYWFSMSKGGINFIKIIIAAFAIKVAKHRWYKQKEKERMEKEKIDAELQLLQAQIHPGFLFNTLNNIYSSALAASPKAPEMLMKLSEILSYMLYECNDSEVSVDKEIKMIKDYMALEKTRFGDTLEMYILLKGSGAEEKIAPMLLLPFIENSFKQCSSRMTAQPWISLEIEIKNNVLNMKLLNGKPPEKEITEEPEENGLYQAQRRLELLYPARYALEITEEPEIMMVSLQINLHGLPEKHGPLTGRIKPIGILQAVSET